MFIVEPPIAVLAGDMLRGSVKLTRQKSNHRLLYLEMQLTHSRPSDPAVETSRSLHFRVD